MIRIYEQMILANRGQTKRAYHKRVDNAPPVQITYEEYEQLRINGAQVVLSISHL
jgi:hypothetical protein